MRRSRKCFIDVMQVFFRQGYVETSGILLHMGDAACFGNSDDILCTHYPRQHDLCGSGIMPAGNLYQRLVVAQPSFAQRRVGHDGNTVLLAQRDKVVFDAPVFYVLEHLIGGAVLSVW